MIQWKLVDETLMNFFKTGEYDAIFRVLEVKRSKILQKLGMRDFLFTF